MIEPNTQSKNFQELLDQVFDKEISQNLNLQKLTTCIQEDMNVFNGIAVYEKTLLLKGVSVCCIFPTEQNDTKFENTFKLTIGAMSFQAQHHPDKLKPAYQDLFDWHNKVVSTAFVNVFELTDKTMSKLNLQQFFVTNLGMSYNSTTSFRSMNNYNPFFHDTLPLNIEILTMSKRLDFDESKEEFNFQKWPKFS